MDDSDLVSSYQPLPTITMNQSLLVIDHEILRTIKYDTLAVARVFLLNWAPPSDYTLETQAI